ncbi:hypothetical protein IQ241_03495 [Romeria aff. gracilis LEGE 07310]|uniref:Uncharacterized protein n=1 Tax=Vasconcelosia minhoensis LEGE 07310 TaxID=915328 RepID=A0A8J7A4V9_9CYAN|nr:HHL1-like protein [Romeria gracilis]MBE9076367.1 hypothetical protein [Romeria aff. gracilis LEGE 07310]
MSDNLGFGKPKQSQPKVSKRSKERVKATERYEKMKSDGTPDYEVYIRVQGQTQWYPVGVIAVKRSSQINRAIFGSRDNLLQGAFRLYPVLKKNQERLEYGYRLKEFKDDPIQLAVEPGLGKGVQSAWGKVGQKMSSLFGSKSQKS